MVMTEQQTIARLTTLNCDITVVCAACDATRRTGGTNVKAAVRVKSTTEGTQPDGLATASRSAESTNGEP